MHQLIIGYDTAGLVQQYTIIDVKLAHGAIAKIKSWRSDWITIDLGPSTSVYLDLKKVVSFTLTDLDHPEQIEVARWSYAREKFFDELRKQAEPQVGFGLSPKDPSP